MGKGGVQYAGCPWEDLRKPKSDNTT